MSVQAFFNEMTGMSGVIRDTYRPLRAWLDEQEPARLKSLHKEAETIFRRLGITFAVYGDSEAVERLIPFDIIPRILTAEEWRHISRGLEQRIRALNAFLYDIYHRQEIVRAGRIPEHVFVNNKAFAPEMIGFDPPRRIYSHIVGIDIVRVGESDFYVLEDNTRVPSGVSYMLENRETMMRMFPELFARYRVAPVDHYPDLLLRTLQSVAPDTEGREPTIVLLTPGIYNAAYFEHSFLADQMGIELVEGPDLVVRDGRVYMRTTQGPLRVDVIYRRIDDDFLDPLVYRPDSMLGVPGLMDVYRAGHVAIVNAPGSGIADDKAIYRYVPEMIRFYTGQEPILKNVPTYACSEPEDRAYVLENLHDLVIKEVHGSGGYGMLIGPAATKQQRAAFAEKIRANPDRFIAQPTLALSACATVVEQGIAPRHVDFRPFVLMGDTVRFAPGGLTRVALIEGSLVVNSSQGGGTKDTWVLED